MYEHKYRRLSIWEPTYDLVGYGVEFLRGAILISSPEKSYFAQLKFRNISGKPIDDLYISIEICEDGTNEPRIIPYKYADLHAADQEEFGDNVPIYLSDKNITSINVSIEKYLLESGHLLFASKYEKIDLAYPLPQIDNDLKNWVNDHMPKELMGKCPLSFYPSYYKNGWICSCGKYNTNDTCHRCGRKKHTQFSLITRENLQNLKTNAQKRKRKIAILASSLSVVAVISLTACISIRSFQNKKEMERQQKELAEQMEQQREMETIYQSANDKQKAKKYEEAIELYEQVIDYKDSNSKIEECETLTQDAELHEQMKDYITQKNFDEAKNCSEQISDLYDDDHYITLKNNLDLYYEKVAPLVGDWVNKDGSRTISISVDVSTRGCRMVINGYSSQTINAEKIVNNCFTVDYSLAAPIEFFYDYNPSNNTLTETHESFFGDQESEFFTRSY